MLTAQALVSHYNNRCKENATVLGYSKRHITAKLHDTAKNYGGLLIGWGTATERLCTQSSAQFCSSRVTFNSRVNLDFL